jgi:predicted Zn-dependent protease with MMP-like domain
MAGSEPTFEQLVAEAIDGLPKWVLERMENVQVVVEDEPPVDAPNLLGLYHGIPLTERGNNYTWALPDQITLYRATIETVARGQPEAIRRVVTDTVVHEVAHFFGISDERLTELGRD